MDTYSQKGDNLQSFLWNPSLSVIGFWIALDQYSPDHPSKTKTKKKGSGGKYLHHAMPCGARPIPINDNTGKREVGGWEFFYQGWQHQNPTEEKILGE